MLVPSAAAMGLGRCRGGCGWCAVTGARGVCGLGSNGAGAQGGGWRRQGRGVGLVTLGWLTAGMSGLRLLQPAERLSGC